MTPPAKLFQVAKGTPKNVAKAIISSFHFYWLDKDACVSRLRTAVEIFLDTERIDSRRSGGAPIPLGQRLEEYKKSHGRVAEMLEAVKWLGDTGAHELGNVNRESVNAGLRQISRALAQRYIFDKDDIVAKEIIRTKDHEGEVSDRVRSALGLSGAPKTNPFQLERVNPVRAIDVALGGGRNTNPYFPN